MKKWEEYYNKFKEKELLASMAYSIEEQEKYEQEAIKYLKLAENTKEEEYEVR